MKESFWGSMVIILGVIAIAFIFFFQTITNVDQQDYNLLRETTEAAMLDAFDLSTYKATGEVRIDGEKFVENFIRRFANSVSLSGTYDVYIYDVNETPPKVTLEVLNSRGANVTGGKNDYVTFDISNRLSAILETPY